MDNKVIFKAPVLAGQPGFIFVLLWSEELQAHTRKCTILIKLYRKIYYSRGGRDVHIRGTTVANIAATQRAAAQLFQNVHKLT